MNQTLRPFLNLDLADDENDGSTPLIYASCFGKLETVKFLLEVGAKVDVQDKIGWTALMWATTNGHSQIAQVLLEHSASFETKSKSGRTIYDLVDVENAKMVSTLTIQPSVLKEKRKSLCSIKTATVEYKQEEEKELEVCRASFRSVHKFVWDECLPDQMFVFAQEEVNHILNIAITELELPMKSKAEIYVPANIIFLSARFAHYFTSRELLHQLLSSTLERMNQVIKLNENNVHTIAFWISNVSQLLFYLKKDPGLVVATAEFQLEMSELISESYNFLVMDSEKRLGRIFEPAILEFEPLEVEAVEFADDWHRFFRRSRTSVSSPSAHRKSWIAQDHIRPILSPQSVTNLLSSILYVLHSYEVHPVIVIQAIAQLFHYLSCEIFNHILSNKRYLCRSKALQIRMNMTVLEEWVREYQLPNTLNAYFDPVIQLLQVLQCMSQLTDLMDFITTTKAFDLLNPIQLKRVVLDYHYEVSEAKLPEEIEKYTMQLAEDTFKSIQEEKKVSLSIDRNRPTSISSLGSLLHFSISQPKQQQQQQQRFSVSQEDDMAESNNRDSITEKRDSKYMLPFSLPTTTNYSGWRDKQPQISDNSTLSDTIYLQLKQKLLAEKNAKESNIVPSIPEDWLQRLDHHTK
ncbi:uncharacterized protein B0P05DRAFT_521825 [Gilbertella persicaria]|uniref:uncharacterized protein n=1 Tax=Gilbertella persicaria TaxID=101096 RepID=UPI002220EB0F|nr:uncharacterized protein B0P05DRAFT_521825 [Gilbertella persicaria]KAI8098411.1 hypothetical protein B0P05DRAFT_521825 [Gilbertella persicaria]